jgi:Tn3 transposase DDE domain
MTPVQGFAFRSPSSDPIAGPEWLGLWSRRFDGAKYPEGVYCELVRKGAAKNSLARAVFLNRLGEIRDRSFENQRYRASGLNLVVAAIVLWNTVYLERTVQALRDSGKDVDDRLLPHLSPLGWEHINLTGDYVWRQSRKMEQRKFRPLRMLGEA